MIILLALSPQISASSDSIQAQANSFGIPAFLNQSRSYTKEAFPDLNLNTIFESGIQGKLNIARLFWDDN